MGLINSSENLDGFAKLKASVVVVSHKFYVELKALPLTSPAECSLFCSWCSQWSHISSWCISPCHFAAAAYRLTSTCTFTCAVSTCILTCAISLIIEMMEDCASSKRRLCPHCNESLTLPVFKKHKDLYYVKDRRWTYRPNERTTPSIERLDEKDDTIISDLIAYQMYLYTYYT